MRLFRQGIGENRRFLRRFDIERIFPRLRVILEDVLEDRDRLTEWAFKAFEVAVRNKKK